MTLGGLWYKSCKWNERNQIPKEPTHFNFLNVVYNYTIMYFNPRERVFLDLIFP